MFDQNENRQNPEVNPVNYSTYYHSEQNAENNSNTGVPNQNGGASYVNYYSDPNEQPKKSGGGKTFLKIVAALAALAIVSVSSIELYKLLGTKTELEGNRGSAANSSTVEEQND